MAFGPRMRWRAGSRTAFSSCRWGDRRDYLAYGELYENGLWPEDAPAIRSPTRQRYRLGPVLPDFGGTHAVSVDLTFVSVPLVLSAFRGAKQTSPLARAKKRSRGKFFGRRQEKPVQPEVLQETRAIDPARSVEDWEEWLRIVRPPMDHTFETHLIS
jgi:hypothetical protein